VRATGAGDLIGLAEEITGACATAGFGASTTSAVDDGSLTSGEGFSATSLLATVFFATAFFATAFFTAAFLTGVFSLASSDFFTAAFLTAFLTAFGSSGCTSRTRPSRCAFVRTRSAC
jgi:ABC-type Na+ efflux pump permease subunit